MVHQSKYIESGNNYKGKTILLLTEVKLKDYNKVNYLQPIAQKNDKEFAID